MEFLVFVLRCAWSYPATFWHFNSFSNPGPDVTVMGPSQAIVGGALSLNDQNQYYAQVSSNITIGDRVTFIARVQAPALPYASRIMDFHDDGPSNNIILRSNYGMLFEVGIFVGGTWSGFSCTNNQPTPDWFTVAFTAGDGNGALYINGQQYCTSTTLNPIPRVYRRNQYIGKSAWQDPYIAGYLDFLWYIPRVLSSDEMALVDVDIRMGNDAWVFQPSASGVPGTLLFGSPVISSNGLELWGDPTKFAKVTSLNQNIKYALTIAARVTWRGSLPGARVVDFSNTACQHDVYIMQGNDSSNSLVWGLNNGDCTSRGQVTCSNFFVEGEAVNIVVTVNQHTMIIYKNGIQCNISQDGNEALDVYRSNLFIGASSTNQSFNGTIDWVGYWPRSFFSNEAYYLTAFFQNAGRCLTALTPMVKCSFSNQDPHCGYQGLNTGNFQGGALDLTGDSSGYAYISSNISIGGPFTVAIRALSRDDTTSAVLMDFGDGTTGNSITVYTQDSSICYQALNETRCCSNFMVANTWFHLIIVHDVGGYLRFYHDSYLFCSPSPLPLPASVYRPNQFIGAPQVLATLLPWNGLLDYFHVYPWGLSDLDAWSLQDHIDKASTVCAAVIPEDPRVRAGTCTDHGIADQLCTLACTAPYVPFNVQSGTCSIASGSENAVWTSQAIDCVQSCPSLTAPENGTVQCGGVYGGHFEGSTCGFSCNQTFSSNGTLSRTCLTGGFWSGKADVQCTPNCPDLQFVNGSLSCAGSFSPFVSPSVCALTCDSGFVNIGPTAMTCQADHTWTELGACGCAIPPSIPNGNTICPPGPRGAPNTYGASCFFSCEANYALSGNSQVTCQGNGQWSGTVPQCNLVMCPPLQAPVRGRLTCDQGTSNVSFSASATCITSCNPGFNVTGTAAQTCLITGNWSAAPATCDDANECQNPNACPFGAKCLNTFGNYSCSPFFLTNVTHYDGQTDKRSGVLQSSLGGDNISAEVYIGWNVKSTISNLTYGPNGFHSFPCLNATFVPSNVPTVGNLSCVTIPGLGAQLHLLWPFTTGNPTTTEIFIAASPEFQYPTPTITPSTLRVIGQDRPGTSIFANDIEQGDVVAFAGTNFLPDPTLLKVTFGRVGLVQYPCTLLPDNSSTALIACKIPPQAVPDTDYVFTINANGVQVIGLDTYSVVETPFIVGVLPADDNCSMEITTSGPAVSSCPTGGNVLITVIGRYVTLNFLNVFVAGQECVTAQALCVDGRPSLCNVTCSLPPGTGVSQTVVITSDNKYSQPQKLISYAAPIITSIEGCTVTGPLSVVDCSRAGGDTITVNGIDFGTSGATISIGSTPCLSTDHDFVSPQTKVSCVTPPGFGVGQPLQLFQQNGPVSTAYVPVSFVQCPKGYYQNGVALTCKSCAPGTYSAVPGSPLCLPCDSGTNSSSDGATTCASCIAGRVSEKNGAVGPLTCDDCPIGTYVSSEKQVSCQSCPVGKFANQTGRSLCDDCAPGYYQPDTGMTACISCKNGTYAALPGRSECTPCPPGMKASINGSSVCIACPAGSYQPKTHSTNCLACDVGSFTDIPGEATCKSCPNGHFANGTGSTECTFCPAGTYQSGNGASFCPSCAAGTASAAGTSSCGTCGSGLISSNGAQECMVCPAQSSPSIDKTTCLCAPGLAMTGNVCTGCPVGALCNERGLSVTSLPTMNGYFTLQNSGDPMAGNATNDASQVTYMRCLKPQACVAGQCTDNRAGVLCGVCASGYTMSQWTKSCVKCPARNTAVHEMWPTVVAILLAVALIYLYIIRSALRGSAIGKHKPSSSAVNGSWRSQARAESALQNLEPIRAIYHRKETPEQRAAGKTYALKLVIGFFQVLSAILNLPVAGQLAFPSYYMIFLSYFQMLNLDFIPWQNLSCVWHTNYYTRIVVLTLSPVVLVTVLALVVGLTHALDIRDLSDADIKRERRAKVRMVFVRGSIFTAFVLYPTVSAAVLSHFVCYRVGNQSLVMSDFTVQCYSPEWYRWTYYVIVSIIVYPVGIPLVFFFLLYRHRKRLDSPFAMLGMGLLHEVYDRSVWWFEIPTMLEKLILTSLLQFVPLRGQLPTALVVVGCFTLTLMLLQPESTVRNWSLHLLTNVEIFLVVLVSHFQFVTDVFTVPPAVDITMSILFIFLTVALVFLLFLDALKAAKNWVWRQRFTSETKAASHRRNQDSFRVSGSGSGSEENTINLTTSATGSIRPDMELRSQSL